MLQKEATTSYILYLLFSSISTLMEIQTFWLSSLNQFSWEIKLFTGLLVLSLSRNGIDRMTQSCWLKSLLAGWSRRDTFRFLQSLFFGTLFSCTLTMLITERKKIGERISPNCLSFIINVCKMMHLHHEIMLSWIVFHLKSQKHLFLSDEQVMARLDGINL